MNPNNESTLWFPDDKEHFHAVIILVFCIIILCRFIIILKHATLLQHLEPIQLDWLSVGPEAVGARGWASCCFGPEGPCVPDFKIDLIANSWQS